VEKIIVIVSKRTGKDDLLIALLKKLFPECEVHTCSLNVEDFESSLKGTSSGFQRGEENRESNKGEPQDRPSPATGNEKP
jgi:hypothetical protein